jgi:hypothetical protein
MTNFDLNWQGAKILARADAGARLAAVALNADLRKAIESPVYKWPRNPSPRAIVKTGRLRDSQTLSRKGGLTYQYDWPVEYSGYVLRGTDKTLGRDWIRVALKRGGKVRQAFIAGFKRG